MLKTIVVGQADHNWSVENLMNENAKSTGKNYLDMDTGDIVQIVEEEPKKETSTETPKKRGRKPSN